MGRHRILVVDDSPAVRETIAIVLGGDHEVRACAAEDYSAESITAFNPRLIIAASGPLSFPPGIPVLWLDPPRKAKGAFSSAPSMPPPAELRARVAGALAGSGTRDPTKRVSALLRPPFVTSEAAHVLALALATGLPLHLTGEAGCGAQAVAREIHEGRGLGRWLALHAGDLDATTLENLDLGGGTLFIADVDRLPRPAQETLLSALDPAGRLRPGAGTTCRLITAASTDLSANAVEGPIAPELSYRLTALVARLLPLRQRAEDIPALARILGDDLARRFGRAPVKFTARALARLSNYWWFGDLAELQAVLARTIACAPPPEIDAEDLLFDGARLPRDREAADPAAEAGEMPAPAGRPFELLAHELAHEIKNPLVAIKTFNHCARAALADSADTAELAQMAEDAVDRIDHLLENLLAYTRLAAPMPQTVPLAAVLDAALDAAGIALATRGVTVDRPPALHPTVRGDSEQVAYALANLLDAATAGLAPGSHLAIDAEAPATLTIARPAGAGPLGGRLATLVDRPAGGAPALPLRAAIAAEVLERNGAELRLANDGTVIRVFFTPAVATAAEPEPAPAPAPAPGPREAPRRGGRTVELRGGRSIRP